MQKINRVRRGASGFNCLDNLGRGQTVALPASAGRDELLRMVLKELERRRACQRKAS